MLPASLSVLYEDNHLLVVNKPAPLTTQGANPGEESLCEIAKSYLKRKYDKPGNVFLGVVSRLDAMVSGVIVLARTSKAAARLNEQFRDGDVEKIYVAIVERAPVPLAGICEDHVLKDDEAHRMRVVSGSEPGSQRARLSYQTVRSVSMGTMLEVRLETGRKHQIRLQLSSRGWPVVGDRKYGAKTSFPRGIALHSRKLSLQHPTTREKLNFEAPFPAVWPK